MFALAASTLLTITPADDGGGLRWDAPAGCPNQAQMADRIAAAGGRGELSVDAIVTQEADGAWRLDLTLDLDGQRDRRTLRGADCASVADAAELLIAVQLDTPVEVPDRPEPAQPTAPEPPPSTDGPVEQPADDASDPPPPSAARRAEPPALTPLRHKRIPPTGVMLGVAAGVAAGAVPLPGVPIELAVGRSWPRLRIAARGRYYLPRRVALGDDRFALVQLGTVGAEACARPGLLRLEFPICGQLSVGGSRSDGRGPNAGDRAGAWAETGVDVGLAWSATPTWALTARVGAAAVIAGTRYVLDTVEVFDPAPVTGRVVVGVEAHFGSRSARGRRRGR